MYENERAIRHERLAGDGVRLHVATAGKGPPVILLHGFPENWRSWRRQIPALAASGFSVYVPDLRGYNLSDRPPRRNDYQLDHLVADVVALIHATGHPRVHLAGHDWGGVIAWGVAGKYPQLVDKLVIFNAPHLDIYLKKVRYPLQMLRSWYVLFFLLPRLPELVLSAENYSAVRHMFEQGPARKAAFSSSDVNEYIHALSQPGALTAGLNYYRANLSVSVLRRFARMRPVDAETLVIWGDRDPALGTELLEGLEDVVPRLRIHRIPDSSHWVQNEAPVEVNRVFVDFLSGKNAF
jgi:pimeloyl-ACP methyl ester carboxylesterase